MRTPSARKLTGALILVLCASIAVLCIFASAYKAIAGAYRIEDTVLRIDDYEHQTETTDSYLGVKDIYRFMIPKAAARGQQLCFYVQHQYVSVLTAENRAYINSEISERHIGHTPGHYWVCLPIRQQDAGREAVIELTSVYPSFQKSDPIFYIASKYNVLELSLRKDFLLFAVCVITIASGLLLCIFSILTQFSNRDTLRMLYLGLLTLAVGIWKLMGIPFMYLLYSGNGRMLYYAGMLSLVAVPVFCTRFLYYQENGEVSFGSKSSLFSVLVSLLIVVLQIFNIKELHDFAFFLTLEAAFICSALTVIMIRKKKADLWLYPLPIAMIADCLIIRLTASSAAANCLLLWVFLSGLVRGGSFIRENIQRERTMRKQAEELRDARITALMNQIRPHFIHNTLASVYYLCDDDPAKAKAVIKDFMYYLQNNYSAITKKTTVPFEEELHHVQAYIAVEQVRFEGELDIEYAISYLEFNIPPLTIQPLVENSVKYGIGAGISPEKILLSSRRTEGGSEVIIQDDGAGFDPQSLSKAPHMGIENVRRRLEIMCNGTLRIESEPSKGTKVTIFIPDET